MKACFAFIFLAIACSLFMNKEKSPVLLVHQTPGKVAENTVGSIALPNGYKRETETGFGKYLNSITLKKDKRVYLFNGQLKSNQNAQYAVLDISVGNKDLQQCADAVMRLRAEYLFGIKMYDQIEFETVNGTTLNFKKWLNGQRFKAIGNRLMPYYVQQSSDTRKYFYNYLDFVFSYCGTASLGASLKNKRLQQIAAGDVFLKPGTPGHAVIVLETAINNRGEKIYLLAQSYMPAQNIHVLKNSGDNALNPWYKVNALAEIDTPEWTFYFNQLYEWKKN